MYMLMKGNNEEDVIFEYTRKKHVFGLASYSDKQGV